jgi:hypothetical protein
MKSANEFFRKLFCIRWNLSSVGEKDVSPKPNNSVVSTPATGSF